MKFRYPRIKSSVLRLMLLALCSFLATACSSLPAPSSDRWGRVTLYHRDEDRWGNRIASSKHRRAVEGRTIAASSKFPFGTVIHFPGLKKFFGHDDFIVEDRGSAVERRKASYGKTEVFDFYVDKHHFRQYVKLIPDYLPFHL